MIKETSEGYENEDGEVTVQTHTCSEHGNEIKYVMDGARIVPVFIPPEEANCETWQQELGIL